MIKAFDFMLPLAMDYATGAIPDIEGLKKAKADRLKLVGKPGPAVKRPAAATSSSVVAKKRSLPDPQAPPAVTEEPRATSRSSSAAAAKPNTNFESLVQAIPRGLGAIGAADYEVRLSHPPPSTALRAGHTSLT